MHHFETILNLVCFFSGVIQVLILLPCGFFFGFVCTVAGLVLSLVIGNFADGLEMYAGMPAREILKDAVDDLTANI